MYEEKYARVQKNYEIIEMKSWDKVKLNLINRVNGLVLNIKEVLPVLEMNSLIEDSFGFKNKIIKEEKIVNKKEVSENFNNKIGDMFSMIENNKIVVEINQREVRSQACSRYIRLPIINNYTMQGVFKILREKQEVAKGNHEALAVISNYSMTSRDKVKLKLKDRIFGLVLNKEVILPVLEMNRLIEDCFESNNNRNKKINQDNDDSSITGDSKSLPVYEDYWEISHNLEGEISNNLINNNKLEVNKEHNFYLNIM
jgi:hypothetical protein